MTAQQALEAQFEDKLNTLMPYLVKTARGDEDLIQEGAIGIWQSMTDSPRAANKFYATKAKWSIITVARGVGKSVDIPKQYPRKFPSASTSGPAHVTRAKIELQTGNQNVTEHTGKTAENARPGSAGAWCCLGLRF